MTLLFKPFISLHLRSSENSLQRQGYAVSRERCFHKKVSKVELYDLTTYSMTVHPNLIEHNLQGPRYLHTEKLLRFELALQRQ